MLTKVVTVTSTDEAEALVRKMGEDGYDILDVKVVTGHAAEITLLQSFWQKLDQLVNGTPHDRVLVDTFLVTITYNPTDRSDQAEAREKAREKARVEQEAQEQARKVQERRMAVPRTAVKPPEWVAWWLLISVPIVALIFRLATPAAPSGTWANHPAAPQPTVTQPAPEDPTGALQVAREWREAGNAEKADYYERLARGEKPQKPAEPPAVPAVKAISEPGRGIWVINDWLTKLGTR